MDLTIIREKFSLQLTLSIFRFFKFNIIWTEFEFIFSTSSFLSNQKWLYEMNLWINQFVYTNKKHKD